jgi:hypothetical protein
VVSGFLKIWIAGLVVVFILICFLNILLLFVVGVLGAGLHIIDTLTAGGQFVMERFMRGAPLLALRLFANMGSLGLITLLDPEERIPEI